jgi:hypothetical protein
MWHNKWLQAAVIRVRQSAHGQLTGKRGYNATSNNTRRSDNLLCDSSNNCQAICPDQYL